MQIFYGKLSELSDIAFIGSLYLNLKSEYKRKLVQDYVEKIGGTKGSWEKNLQAWARGEENHTSYHRVETIAREIAQGYGDVLLRDKIIETPWVVQ